MRIIIALAVLFFISAGCQQKETPKPQAQFPAGRIQIGEMLKLAQEATKKYPGNVNAWIELGNIFMDSSRFNEAIDAYQKALDIDPRNVDVRVDMGTCYKNIGKPDLAVKEYRKALEINPGHPNGHRNLAVVLSYDLKDKVQGVKEFEKYLQLAPNAPDSATIRQEIEKLRAAK